MSENNKTGLTNNEKVLRLQQNLDELRRRFCLRILDMDINALIRLHKYLQGEGQDD